jgi:hypothetical protein
MANGMEKKPRKWDKVLAQTFLEHPDWNAPQFYRQLEIVLAGDRIPTSLSAVQKKVSQIRKNFKNIKETGLDNLWHLGTLKDYPLPPEGIAKVFAIKCTYGRPPKRPKGAWGITLSIREALWISRLSSLPMSLDKLQETALDYADAERVGELSGIPFDTYDRDEEIYEVLRDPGQVYLGEHLKKWRQKHEGTHPQEG